MNLAPTRVRLLAAMSAAAFVASYLLILLWYRFNTTAWDLQWTTAVAMLILVIALTLWTMLLRARMRNGSARLNPITVARSAALAMATSRVGTVVVGNYAGLALFYGTHLHIEINSQRLWIAITTSLLGFMTIAIALWLESICRIPEPPTSTS